MKEKSEKHIPVLCELLLEHLEFASNAVIIDATLGLAGHAKALASRLDKSGILVGLDVDSDNLAVARKKLQDCECKLEFVRENFSQLDDVLGNLGNEGADVILADIGVSSTQLDNAERGFSFQQDGPLDMRMDDRLAINAADVVNGYKQDDIANILYQYGQERRSRRIAREIFSYRKKKKIERTSELAQIVLDAFNIKATTWRGKIHPATRTFQALRIAVNQELESLERLLDVAPQCLKPNGQIAVITFHSLEDRLVKFNFRDNHKAGLYEVQTKKPLVADEQERMSNPRSRSAKLRVARRTDKRLNESELQEAL